ncbi:glycosyltransferase family 4 protein [uncultured Desulfobacter sp.]|uniref:glycosyltransferase family 4 protein n=1 Tax=uncultured Desulfobacter sp. TaxID=240139 RepID=UPI0029F4DF34|nr:glycosyltransferase family 4 protein [uncultured Desulfobacter sp.]
MEISRSPLIKLLTPRLNNMGGVANFYRVMQGYLGPQYEYLFRGSGRKEELKLFIPWRLCKDYRLFCKKMNDETMVVVINSSLGVGGFFRDGLYCLLTPNRVRNVVFFRGWNSGFEKKIDDVLGMKAWFNRTFLTADHIIVLSSRFKKKLRQWGYTGPVSLGTTIVDEQLLENVTFQSLSQGRTKNLKNTILYLGNISKAKGVIEVIQAYQLLCGPNGLENLQCVIAGHGNMLSELKEKIDSQSLGIRFPGYVREKQKVATFKNANIYVFPSAHGEGMPNSVLEAMAFGLPVLTTRVGGVPDFFEEGKMGLFLDTRDPEHIAEKIRYLLDRPELMRQMSEYNYHYAKEHFYASKVAERFKNLVESVGKFNARKY